MASPLLKAAIPYNMASSQVALLGACRAVRTFWSIKWPTAVWGAVTLFEQADNRVRYYRSHFEER